MNATQLLEHFDRLAEAPGAVPRLRRFILDLAVRGKLVEQDAGDEPAARLLMRIQTERFRALNKPVKREALLGAEPESTDIQLPVGWAWSKLGNLCTKTGSGSTPAGGKDAYVSSGVPFLRSQNVYDDGLRLDGVALISDVTQERMSSTTVKAGDLLLNITGGSIGRCAIVPDSFVIGNINQHVAIIRLALLESGRFLHSVICSDYFQKHIFGNQTGAGREGLPKNRMDEILIPIAPLAEQHRIVAKVDELMALCNQLEAAQQERERRRDRLAVASLQRLNQPVADTTPEAQREHARFHLHHLPRVTTRPEHIKAMRQTIHNLAVRGRLVMQTSSEQSAHDLLKQMQAQKTLLIEDGTLPKSKDLAQIGVEEMPSVLPSTWCWTRIESVCAVIVDCPHSTATFIASGVICLDTNSFKAGAITPHKIRYVSEDTYQERIQRLEPQSGDLIFAREGSVGESVIVPEGMRCCLGQRVMLFRPLNGIASSFFQLALSEPSSLARLLTLHKGVGAKHVNVADMRNALLPLPPLAEQHRIVAKVDELMALCDQLEAQLTTTQTDSRRLLESVLDAALAPV